MFNWMKADVNNIKNGLGFFATGLISIYTFIIPRLIDEFNKISSYYKLKGIQILKQDEVIRLFVFLFPSITVVSISKLLYFGITPIDFIPMILLIIHSVAMLVFFVLYLFWIVSNRAEYVIRINEQTMIDYEQG